MSMTTDPATREAFIAGLRDLADFLAANPGVAVSVQPTCLTVVATGRNDEENVRDINEFAAAASAVVTDLRSDSGHHSGYYGASLKFGPVEYKAFAYTDASMAAFAAERSYEDNIRAAVSPSGLSDDAPAELGEVA